jgi:hypothetical protein
MAPGMAPGVAPGVAPGTLPAAPAGYSSGSSTLDVIYESIFNNIYTKEDMARWTPMTLGGFFSFSDGWDTPYVFPKNSDNGTPRHAWLGTGGLGGVFYRAWFFAFAYLNDIGPRHAPNNNLYVGQYTIFVPLNRRFEFQFDYQFIVSDRGGTSNRYHGNTGDLTIHNRFMLSESDKFGQLFELAVRVPTGALDNGNGVASLSPTYSFWWTPYPNWSVRGLTGPTVPTNHAPTSGYSTYQNSLAIGRYFKGSDDGWIQQLWFYLVASENSVISGPHPRESAFSLQPGLRCRVPFLSKVGTGYWYAFAAVEVPMAGPPHSHDDYQMTYAFLYDY